MHNRHLLTATTSFILLLALAACSASPTPTPTPSPDLTSAKAAAVVRAIVAQDPNCDDVVLVGARFDATWQPDTLTWSVHVTAPNEPEPLEGTYLLFEERNLSYEIVEPLIPGQC